MNFSCEKCGRKYSIPDEKVGDKGVRIRCKHCSHVIVLQPPSASPEESTRMVSLAELERGGVAARQSAPAPQPAPQPAPRAKSPGAAAGKSARTEIAQMPVEATHPGAQSPWEGEATRAVVAPDPKAQWFAMVKGQQVGPFDLRGLAGKVKQAEVGLKSFVWREGMGDWKRAEELPELALMFAGGLGKEEPRPAPARNADSNKALLAALQKSAPVSAVPHGKAVTREMQPMRAGEPLIEPRRIPVAEASPEEMWPAPAPAGASPQPLAFDLTVDAPVPEPEPPAAAPAPAAALSLASTIEVAPELEAAPAAAPAAPASTAPSDLGADLFSDLDLSRRSGEHLSPFALGKSAESSDGAESTEDGERGGGEGKDDPFSKMGPIPASMLPKPVESTNYIIAKAGVDRRNPAWKIVALVVALIGLPLGILSLLSALQVVPPGIARVDETTGEEVVEPWFSTGAVTGIKDLLTGNKKQAKPARPTKPAAAASAAAAPAAAAPKDASKAPEPSASQLAALYGDQNKRDVGPAAAKAPEPPPEEDEDAGGPPREEVARVVAQHQPAFQSCIEQELKKNPNFKGGKVHLMATVGSSGVVKRAEIDRKDINTSDLGECLKSRAKRMSFAAFSGDEVELEIPLILTATM